MRIRERIQVDTEKADTEYTYIAVIPNKCNGNEITKGTKNTNPNRTDCLMYQ